MNIAFVYAKGRKDRYDQAVQGLAATEFFYGALEMEQQGHIATQYEFGDETEYKYWHRVAEQLYRWKLTPTRTNGAILAQLSEMCPSLNKQDIIIATTTAAAFGLATLKLFGLVKRPIVAIHCGIVNYQLIWWRKNVNKIALRHMWTQLFGEAELSYMVDLYHVQESRIEINQFGVDTKFWTPGDDKGDYVLAVGNDERRDYELLIRVAAKIDVKVIIVTRRKINIDLPSNVEILMGGWHEEALTDEKLRNLYRNARMVVIPLIDSPQPSGQSVCLQSMSCGKATVLTLTEGLWSHSMMRDDDNVVLVPPNDADALYRSIKRLLEDHKNRKRIGSSARQMVCKEGDIMGFSKRLEALCQRVLIQA